MTTDSEHAPQCCDPQTIGQRLAVRLKVLNQRELMHWTTQAFDALAVLRHRLCEDAATRTEELKAINDFANAVDK